MSKVSTYLQSHLSGEVITRSDVRDIYSRDGSVLQQKPSMVIFPRVVEDTRKIMKFASQLAQKGHPLSVLARGKGGSNTASALTSDIVLDMTHYLNRVFEYDQKRKLIRADAGADAVSVANVLYSSGLTVKGLDPARQMTVGGWISEGVGGQIGDNYEATKKSVSRLEVVLSNGEVIQTGPLNKRELNKKKGLQTTEGAIYRGVEAVLEDYTEIIDKLRNKPYRDMSGYPGILDVVDEKGSFDLTPLFVGAQGTLGVVVEAIMQADFKPRHTSYAVAVFADDSAARDAIDTINSQNPDFIDYFDSAIFQNAADQGVELEWYENAVIELGKASKVLVFGWSDFGRPQHKKTIKKLEKQLTTDDSRVFVPEDFEADELDSLRNLVLYTRYSSSDINQIAPDVIGGFYVPPDRMEDFGSKLKAMLAELQVEAPLYGSAIDSVYTLAPKLSLQKVGDKQKMLKLISNLSQKVSYYGGVYYAHGGEGWLNSRFAREGWSEERKNLNQAIRRVFDPHGVLNKNAKADVQLKDVTTAMISENAVDKSSKITSAR